MPLKIVTLIGKRLSPSINRFRIVFLAFLCFAFFSNASTTQMNVCINADKQAGLFVCFLLLYSCCFAAVVGVYSNVGSEPTYYVLLQ